MKQETIYLDYAATTPVDPRVAEKMACCLTCEGTFANPASAHAPGRKARGAVERARSQVAALVGAEPGEIVFTSGATESDNLAIKGAAHFYSDKGRHLITSRIEHKAVLDTCKQLERDGFEVTWLKPDADGLIQPSVVEQALRPDTVLVSIMHVNNEIGTVNDIAGIGRVTRERGVLLHVDAAQSAGKVPIDLKTLCVDLMSFSGHKLYGPKGIGALYVRREPRVQLDPLMHGGGHEHGMRSGTLATHQIVGMGEAFELARQELPQEAKKLNALREKLWRGLHAAVPQALLNGHPTQRVCGILNVAFPGIEGESLLFACGAIAVSSGSACTSADQQPSFVLRALGRDDQLAGSSIRFSIGRFTTDDEVEAAVRVVGQEYHRLLDLAPAG
ncbi:MAG: IscS subfamily cysteine desulfurase [Gammaproteobacteria bacterium]|nr:IscS subfamily cysteine desulfurase [Gammaproteobacteria bacterium]MDE2345422.1 IscS subfamily cysteine desulfurase [Gammaproteobacteria bacterium]